MCVHHTHITTIIFHVFLKFLKFREVKLRFYMKTVTLTFPSLTLAELCNGDIGDYRFQNRRNWYARDIAFEKNLAHQTFFFCAGDVPARKRIVWWVSFPSNPISRAYQFLDERYSFRWNYIL